jgi:hypothetical protein
LLVVAVIVFSGCVATLDRDHGTQETSITTECHANPLPVSASLNESQRKALPEKPDEFTKSSVEEFVIEYEKTALYNSRYRAGMKRLNIRVKDSEVKKQPDGYLVFLEVTLSSQHRDGSIGDDAWAATYFINQSIVRRAEKNLGTTPVTSPSKTIICW